MRGRTPQTRGRAYLGPLRHLRERYGDAAVARVREEAGPALSAVLEQRIRQASWYPYAPYVELIRIIDRVHGDGDLAYCRELGDWAGQLDLGSMFRIYATLADPERLISASRLVWPQYYKNAGKMRAVSTHPSDTRLRISEFPEMDPAHCKLMEGWMIATMAQIGCRVNPGAKETACTSRGDAHHEFWCTWERA